MQQTSIDMPPGERLPRKILDEHLDYMFRTLLPSQGYNIREPQIELASQLLDNICKRNLTLAEAEVGIGKTLAYLVAATLVKRSRVNDFWMRGQYPEQGWVDSIHMPVVISTSSIALQNAILRDYIPELSRILLEGGVIETPLTAILRKGKEHYLCERRLRECFRDVDRFSRQLLAPLLDSTASVDLADAVQLTAHWKEKICVSGRCPPTCRNALHCRYRQYLKQAMSGQHDFQICNHNYFLADLLRRKRKGTPLLPPYQAVIFDEAHKFLPAAQQMYGVELEANVIYAVSREIRRFEFYGRESATKIWRNAKKLEGQARRLFDMLLSGMSMNDDEAERFPADLDTDSTRCLSNIHRICDELSTQLYSTPIFKRYQERCTKVREQLSQIQNRVEGLGKRADEIFWTEYPSREMASLHAIPQDLDRQLQQDLWCQGIPIVFTSGTLSAAGDFSRFKQMLGLHHLSPQRIMETRHPSPFQHRENALLYISENVPFPDNQDKQYIAAVVDEIERLIGTSHGHAAILFTSYQAMDKVLAELKTKQLPFPLFRLGRSDSTTLQRFRASGNGILFAAGALWEGIDIPGDALSLLIIVRLPFAVPDLISEHEQAQYADLEEYKARVVVPDMLVRLKQGFGRLLRTEMDTGVVALLDARVRMGGTYREQVLAALPECETTSAIANVHLFLKRKKTPDYFS